VGKAASLIIGYGNLDRHDDGVAYYIVNTVRQRLGQQPLTPDDDGLADLGRQTDSIFVHQLALEMVDIVAAYDRLVFVDAHIEAMRSRICCRRILPENKPGLLLHHLHPAALVYAAGILFNHGPRSYLVSVRGHNFDFQRGLSPAAFRSVAAAANLVLGLAESSLSSRAEKSLLQRIPLNKKDNHRRKHQNILKRDERPN